MNAVEDLQAEARAFDERIEDRVKAGFVPDLRRAVRCEYFYKSFWRDPHFIRLYLGAIVDRFITLIAEHAGNSVSILDVGCGAGYVSLELARAGHHVTGIDVSGSCIEVARDTAASNPYGDAFGSLEYRQIPFHDASGAYDVVLFSGCLHHMHDVDFAVTRSIELMNPAGCLLCYEPWHDQWRHADAAQVALIRGLLSITGHWYETMRDPPSDPDAESLADSVGSIHAEYVNERDSNEPGQSPHDNATTGDQIIITLRRNLAELCHEPCFSLIYRLLGGLRGDDDTLRRLADFLTAYDRFAVREGYLKSNNFLFMGRRKSD